MLKTYALIFGFGFALTLAACGQPTPETSSAPEGQAEQFKPEASDGKMPENRPRQNQDGTRRAPPEIAYTACADLALEAACSFQSPRGTRSGICGTLDGNDRAVCVVQRPEGRPARPDGAHPDGAHPDGARPDDSRREGQRPGGQRRKGE